MTRWMDSTHRSMKLMVRRAGTSLYSTISSRSYLNVRCLYLAHDASNERTSDEREHGAPGGVCRRILGDWRRIKANITIRPPA